MPRRRVAAFVLPFALAIARVASADTADAKRMFDEGVELEKHGDYAGALVKFDSVDRIRPTPGLRFHRGYCLEMTGSLVAAFDAYASAVKLATEQNKPEVASAATNRLEALRDRVPELSPVIASGPKNARVELDGASVAAGATIKVDPGNHTITAAAPGFARFVWRENVQIGTKKTVEIKLSAEPLSPTEPALMPPKDEPRGRARIVPIATTAGAVVLVAAGFASFLVAGSTADDAKRECPTKTDCDAERSKVRTLDTLALAGIASGLVLGGLSVYLWTRPDGSAVVVGGSF